MWWSISGFGTRWSRTHCRTAAWWSPKPGTSYFHGYSQIQESTVGISTTWAVDMWLLFIGITSLMREDLTGSHPLLVLTQSQSPCPSAAWIIMFVQHIMRYFKEFLLHCSFTSSVASAKPPAKEHEVSRVENTCLHKLSLQCYVTGVGASTVYKVWLQFYSSNNGCVHSPFKAGENATQRDRNIKRLPIWGERAPNNDSLVITEALFWFLSLSRS